MANKINSRIIVYKRYSRNFINVPSIVARTTNLRLKRACHKEFSTRLVGGIRRALFSRSQLAVYAVSGVCVCVCVCGMGNVLGLWISKLGFAH